MHVGVVGAGLTGLATVHELRQRGLEVTCFEARATAGGVVSSERLDGVVVEHGPQRLRLSGAVRPYLETFDLDDELRQAPPSTPIYVYRDGRLREVPFDLATGIRTDVLSWRGKLRLLKEPFTEGHRSGETAADYFRRKLGSEAYRAVIEPLFGGLYASDPAEMPADVALRPLLELERRRGSLLRVALGRLVGNRNRPPAAVPEEGMTALPRRIAAAYDERVHLDTPVRSIEGSDRGATIITADDEVACSAVVVATDAPAAAALLAEYIPDVADRVGALRYNPLALVYLRAPIDREGLGYQVVREAPLRTLGVSWNGRAFDRDDLVTAFLGGMADPTILDESDEVVAEVAAREFERVTDVDPEVLGVHRVTPGMPAYDRSWTSLTGIELPNELYLVGNYTDRLGIAGRLRQGGRVAAALAGEPMGPVSRVLSGTV